MSFNIVHWETKLRAIQSLPGQFSLSDLRSQPPLNNRNTEYAVDNLNDCRGVLAIHLEYGLVKVCRYALLLSGKA